jgi:ABC-type uncharacterized transport system permease subunit
MAITLAKTNKRQIYSIAILMVLIIIFIALMILIMKPSKKVIYFAPEAISPPEINFSVLQNSVLLRLESYPTTSEITDTIGRANPFIAIATTTATSTKK